MWERAWQCGFGGVGRGVVAVAPGEVWRAVEWYNLCSSFPGRGGPQSLEPAWGSTIKGQKNRTKKRGYRYGVG